MADPGSDNATVPLEVEAIVVGGPGAPLTTADPGSGSSYRDPIGAYLASLNTEKSRTTAIERMRRIARALGVQKDPRDRDAWRRIPWTSLTFAETNMVRSALMATSKPATVRLTLAVLKQALRSCRRLGLISADQCERATDLPRVTGQSARPGRALTSEDMERLEKRFSEIEPPYRQMARALFAVGIGAGLRREELARLLLEGVQGDTLRFVGKGLREAAQPIAPWAQAVLEEWLAARKLADFRSPTVFLLYDEAGQTLVDVPMKPRDVWDLVRRERRAAGIAKITTHDLRRTFVTRAIREDPIHAKTLARHANMATTERYDRRGEEEARELLGRLPPMMGAPRVSEAVALEAAASVARQLGRQPWYAGARIAPDAAEGHVVELLVRRLVNLKTSRVRGVRVVTRVTP